MFVIDISKVGSTANEDIAWSKERISQNKISLELFITLILNFKRKAYYI